MKTKTLTMIALLLAFGLAAFGQSQITSGTIQGVVTDPSGAAVPKAGVALMHVETGVVRSTHTDDEGRYSAPLLPVGEYQVTVSASGFAKSINKGYVLTLGQNLVANIGLKVASSTTEVTVTTEAPLVETAQTSTSTLVGLRSVQDLPLNGRRFLDLAYLTPGVMQEPERNQISFAGQRGINSNINVDGADFNQPFFGGQRGGERAGGAYVVSQEAVQEFQVSRGGFAPEFGRSTGGVVNVITKSGGNQFHGSAFYYLRHKELADSTALGDKTATTRQQFGGSLGGPLRRDKTFFFANYDQQAEHFPTIIRFNGVTTGLPADILAQQGTVTSTNNVNTALAKIDHQVTGNTRVTGRYNYSRNNALNGTFAGGVQTGVPSNNGTEGDASHTVVINVNTVFSPSLLNEFRWQYSYENRPRVNNGEGVDFVNTAGPQAQITGCCYLGGVSYLPILENDSRLQFADNVSYIKGAHSVKLGFDVNRSHAAEIFRGNWRGVYIFNNLTTFLNVLNKVPGAAPDSFRIFFGDGKFDAVQPDVAGFVQDSWKVHPRLTLTFGLRYEASMFPQPVAPNPQIPQTATIPSDKKEWQPRLGLAWDVFGNSRTVFRASSGIFYGRTPGLLLFQAFNSAGNPNVGVSYTLNATQIKQVQAAHPEFVYPYVPASGSAANSSYLSALNITGVKPNASFFASDFHNPRALNFSAGLEQSLGRNMVAGFEWVHVNTVHLERIRDVNLFAPTVKPDASTPPQDRPMYSTSTRPNANYGQMLSQESSSRSNYDGLTWSLKKRSAKGLQFLTSYTLAWNKDDDSNERNYSGITYADAFNLAQEYTWSRLDIRHRWVGSATYDLPLGFQVSSILTFRTGLPFSPFTGVDSNGDGNYTDRPIVNGVMLGRNSYRNTNTFFADMRVSKRWKITERQRVTLMVDMFNFLNRGNLAYSVSSNESSTTALGSQYGKGQTPLATFRTLRLADGSFNRGGMYAGSPFQAQAALRYTF